MKRFLRRRWFLLGLVSALVLGFWQAPALKPYTDQVPRALLVAAVMFGMALPLEARRMWLAIRRPQAVLVAVGVTFGLIPLLAWSITGALPLPIAAGVMIAASVPCTIATASVWTRRAGGNDAVSLLVTMLTNLSCFLVTPAWLYLALGELAARAQGTLDPVRLIKRLALVVLLPVLAAQGLRLWRRVGRWATEHKVPLGVACQLGTLTMVLVGATRSGTVIRNMNGWQSPWSDLVLMVLVVNGLHMLGLFTAVALARGLGVSREDRIAVGFSGSQKTLLVGLDVASEYVTIFGGLALLPMIAYHGCQLMFDTVVADRFRRRGEEQAAAEENGEAALADTT